MPHAATTGRRRRPARAAAAVLAVLATVVALNALVGSASGQQQRDDDLVALGRELFVKDCVQCHGEGGRGVAGQGPSLREVGAAATDFMLRTGRMPLDAPDQRMRRGPSQYSDRERQALVAYVASLPGNGPPIPQVDPSAGDLGRGRATFVAQCAACHGPTGAGIAVGQRDVAPALSAATPLEIAEAIRTGPGVMPVFSSETLPQDELNSTVAWILELRGRDSPGGISVGRSGPVTEGFIAWIVGMGLLTAVIYLLGEREQPPGATPPAPGEEETTGDD